MEISRCVTLGKTEVSVIIIKHQDAMIYVGIHAESWAQSKIKSTQSVYNKLLGKNWKLTDKMT